VISQIRKLTPDDLERALNGRLLIITGAGLSGDSGLQTFRGEGGYWRNLDPTRLATPEAFAADPKLVWEWYNWRRAQARAAQPNAGHLALAHLASAAREALLITQNVDDLHERAQTDPARLVHVHGDLFLNACISCSYRDRAPLTELPPPCPECDDGTLRPGVVWFGESLDIGVFRRVDDFIAGGDCDLVLVVGTTAVFQYIVNWAITARGRNGLLVEVNPEETALSSAADVIYRRRAAEILPELLRSHAHRIS
jgi:NAD-dependent deacetylase